MAGVINIKSLKPTPYLSTKAIIGAYSDQGYNVGLSISNSLTNSIAYTRTRTIIKMKTLTKQIKLLNKKLRVLHQVP